MTSSKDVKMAVMEHLKDKLPQSFKKYVKYFIDSPYEQRIHSLCSGEEEYFDAWIVAKLPEEGPERVIYTQYPYLFFGCADENILPTGEKRFYEYSGSPNIEDIFRASELEDYI